MMGITITHVLVGIGLSAVILAALAFLLFRGTRTLYPVRCVHCWVNDNRFTAVTYSPHPGEWAICSRCVVHYWDLSPSPEMAVADVSSTEALLRPAVDSDLSARDSRPA